MRDDGRVDPLLQRVEALPREGEYAVVLVTADGQEQSVLMRVGAETVEAPAANLGGWSTSSDTYRALTAAVRAVHEARAVAGRQRVLLQDIDGGWDVTLGNVILDQAGRPACIAHGELEPAGDAVFVCATCGAQGRFGDSA
jgi:hypothetical protein